MIVCPECGRQVSDKATVCPTCGYPIAKMNPSGEVLIKMGGTFVPTACIYEVSTGKCLWKGVRGETASFHVDEPTLIAIGIGMRRPPNPKKSNSLLGVDKYTYGEVRAGEGYSYSFSDSGLIGKYVLTRVDVIDSE